nr:type 1 fimbrial protein [Morganella morganii]
MNKKFALAASLSLIFVANSVSAATIASGGSINFTGFITDATCTINNGNADMSVLLDPITVNQISGPGAIDEGKKHFPSNYQTVTPVIKTVNHCILISHPPILFPITAII